MRLQLKHACVIPEMDGLSTSILDLQATNPSSGAVHNAPFEK